MSDDLAALLREALELYERAECVGPTREERARINEIRKVLRMPPMREDYGPASDYPMKEPDDAE